MRNLRDASLKWVLQSRPVGGGIDESLRRPQSQDGVASPQQFGQPTRPLAPQIGLMGEILQCLHHTDKPMRSGVRVETALPLNSRNL